MSPLIQHPNLPPLTASDESFLRTLLWAPNNVIEEYKLQYLEMPIEVSRLDFFDPANREEWVNINRYIAFVRLKLFWSQDHFVSRQSTRKFWLGDKCQQRTWRGGILIDPLAPTEVNVTHPAAHSDDEDESEDDSQADDDSEDKKDEDGSADDDEDEEETDSTSHPSHEIIAVSSFANVSDAAAKPSNEVDTSAQPSKDIIAISSDDDEDSLEEIFRHLQRSQKVKEIIVISSDDDEPLVETIVPRKRKAQSSFKSGRGPAKRCTQIYIFDPEVISVEDSDEEMSIVE